MPCFFLAALLKNLEHIHYNFEFAAVHRIVKIDCLLRLKYAHQHLLAPDDIHWNQNYIHIEEFLFGHINQ